MESQVLVLYYHRVADQKEDFNQLCVPPVRFYQQMKYLKSFYPILRPEEDWGAKEGKGVVITFDDGYKDNVRNALPILEELQIPAVVFVTAGNLERNQEFWWDELEYLLLTDEGTPDKVSMRDDIYGFTWDLKGYERRKNCYRSMHHLLKRHFSYEKRENWLEQLYEWRGLERKTRASHEPMNEDDLRRLSVSEYVAIGAHTMTHPCLSVLRAEEQRKEIENSAACLRDILGTEITLFSYPFGQYAEDFGDTAVRICRDAGIKKAVSTMPGIWKEHSQDYRIPRNAVRNWNLFEFEQKIEEMWKAGSCRG